MAGRLRRRWRRWPSCPKGCLDPSQHIAPSGQARVCSGAPTWGIMGIALRPSKTESTIVIQACQARADASAKHRLPSSPPPARS